MEEIFRILNQQPIIIYPAYAQIAGDLGSGMLLARLIFLWARFGEKKFYQTDEQLMEILACSRTTLFRYRKRLILLGYIEVEREGMPSKNYYVLNLEKIFEALKGVSPDNAPRSPYDDLEILDEFSDDQMYQNDTSECNTLQDETSRCFNVKHKMFQPETSRCFNLEHKMFQNETQDVSFWNDKINRKVNREIKEKEKEIIKEKEKEKTIGDLVGQEIQVLTKKIQNGKKIDDVIYEGEGVVEAEFVRKWNDFAVELNLPIVTRLTNERRLALRNAVLDVQFDFSKLLEFIRGSPFLLGENEYGWRVDFDWLFLKRRWIEVLEGKYKKEEKEEEPPEPRAVRILDANGKVTGVMYKGETYSLEEFAKIKKNV